VKVLVDVQHACDGDTIPDVEIVDAWVTRAVDAASVPNDVEVSVRIVNADEIRCLNREYRDQDKATNVLSFPAGPLAGLPADTPLLLGDIVVCASIVASEAAEQGKAVAAHWAHMLVHGTLHLLGFDHEDDSEAATMEALETKILTTYGFPDPYGASGQT
jgi:probable rRNA maturation factor